jgi:hypothetical protein
MTDISGIDALLRPHGLVVLGATDEAVSGEQAQEIVLVGNAGSSIWPAFAGSGEYSDNLPHPLDRWSKRVGMAVAEKLDADIVFPFEGPPYPPVLDWAGNSGQASPSPISLFIHREYGLWHAYRFVLLLREPVSGFPPALPLDTPCLSCTDQPCLSSCPVDAFTVGKYQVDDCVAYLAGDENSACREQGCGARRACPVATDFQYRARHARFHMDAFLASQIQA